MHIYFVTLEEGRRIEFYSIEDEGVYRIGTNLSNLTVPFVEAQIQEESNQTYLLSILKNLKVEFITLPEFSIKWEYGFPKGFDARKSTALSLNKGKHVLIWNQLNLGSTGEEMVLLDQYGNLVQEWSYPFNYVRYRGPDAVKAVDVDNDGFDELFLLFGASMWNQTSLDGKFTLLRMDWMEDGYQETWNVSMPVDEKNSALEIVQHKGITYIATAGESNSPLRVFLDNGTLLWFAIPTKGSTVQDSTPILTSIPDENDPLLTYYPQTVFENVPLTISTFSLLDGSRVGKLITLQNVFQFLPVSYNRTTNKVFTIFGNGTTKTFLHTPAKSIFIEELGFPINGVHYLRQKMVAIYQSLDGNSLLIRNKSYPLPPFDLNKLSAFDVYQAFKGGFSQKTLIFSYRSIIDPIPIIGWSISLIVLLALGIGFYIKYMDEIRFWKKWPLGFIRSMNHVQHRSSPPTSAAIVLPSERTDIQVAFRDPPTIELYTRIHQIEAGAWNEFRKEMGIKLKLIDIFILTEVLEYGSPSCPRSNLKNKFGLSIYRRVTMLVGLELLQIVKTTTSHGAIREEVKITPKGEQLLVFLYRLLEYGMYGFRPE